MINKKYRYIKGEEGEKHLYKIFGENKTLYIKRLKDTPSNKKKISQRGTDLYMMGKCKDGFKYISSLKKIQGSEKELSFDYEGRFYLMSIRSENVIIRER